MDNNFFMALQCFADGEDPGDNNGAGGVAENEQKGNQETVSFDEFLSCEGNQAEFDRRVNKAIQTALSNAQKKWKLVTDDRVSEAEKLAQMTKEEKAEYRANQLQKELDDLKRQSALSEMAKTARKMLTDEDINIPDELVMNLISEDAETTKENVEAFSRVFKGAVQDAVKNALRGKTPRAPSSAGITKDEILSVKDRRERQRLINENMELFKGGI